MCNSGLKVRNFQICTKPIHLFNISNSPSIVKDELAVLRQGTEAHKIAETLITYDTLLAVVFISLYPIPIDF